MFSVIVVKVFVNVPLTILRLFLYQEYVGNVDSLILLVISIELVNRFSLLYVSSKGILLDVYIILATLLYSTTFLGLFMYKPPLVLAKYIL